jgi:hypothetical protein
MRLLDGTHPLVSGRGIGDMVTIIEETIRRDGSAVREETQYRIDGYTRETNSLPSQAFLVVA